MKNNEDNLFSAEKLQEITNKILEKSQVENFIPLTIFDGPTGVVEYVDHDEAETTDKDIFDYLKIKPFTKFIVVGNFKVSATFRQHQKEDLEKLGVNLLTTLTDAQINESASSLTKHYLAKLNELADKNDRNYTLWEKILSFLYNLVKKQYVKKVKIKSVKRLVEHIIMVSNKIYSKNKRGPANFCVVGLKTASLLQDSQYFTSLPLNTNLSSCNTNIYQLGTIANLKVYVDPYLTWSDQSVLIGRRTEKNEPGLHMVSYKTGTSINLIAEDVDNLKSILYTRYAVFDKGFHPEYNYDKFTYKTKMTI